VVTIGPAATPATPSSSAVNPASGRTHSPAPSARDVPSAESAEVATSSDPRASDPSSAPHVPTRTADRTPRSASSSSTIAALGPPIPVAWIVSSSPSSTDGPE
jgi:hypothetical protein